MVTPGGAWRRAVARLTGAIASTDIGRRALVATRDGADTRAPIKTPHGSMTLRVGSDIELYRLRSFWDKEPETISWIERTVTGDSVFCDVGANIGVYTLYALLVGGPTTRALCFEPSGLNFGRLCLNLSDNGVDDRATAMAVGLGSERAVVTFHLSDTRAGAALHHYGEGTKTSMRHEVALLPLDELVEPYGPLPAPTHLKVDVDGPELQVLQGAGGTLSSPRLHHVLVEAHSSVEGDVDALLAAAGFELRAVGQPADGARNRIYERSAD